MRFPLTYLSLEPFEGKIPHGITIPHDTRSRVYRVVKIARPVGPGARLYALGFPRRTVGVVLHQVQQDDGSALALIAVHNLRGVDPESEIVAEVEPNGLVLNDGSNWLERFHRRLES